MHVQDKASLKKRRQGQDPLLGPSSSSGQFSGRDSAATPLQHEVLKQKKKRKDKIRNLCILYQQATALKAIIIRVNMVVQIVISVWNSMK